MNYFTKTEIEKILEISAEGAEIAAKSFKKKDFEISIKPDGSKVSTTDIFLSKFFNEKLSKIFPQPIICEEGVLREVSGDEFFIIDPIDGTSSFIKNDEQFCINIAFIKNKKAVFGLLNIPLFEGGSIFYSNEKEQVVKRDFAGKEKILLAEDIDFNSLRITTSGRSKNEDLQKYIAQFYPKIAENVQIERVSSAIKFTRILEGKANLHVHFRPSMEWDTAPGQALIEKMGGSVKSLTRNEDQFTIGENISYHKADLNNSAFISFIKKI